MTWSTCHGTKMPCEILSKMQMTWIVYVVVCMCSWSKLHHVTVTSSQIATQTVVGWCLLWPCGFAFLLIVFCCDKVVIVGEKKSLPYFHKVKLWAKTKTKLCRIRPCSELQISLIINFPSVKVQPLIKYVQHCLLIQFLSMGNQALLSSILHSCLTQKPCWIFFKKNFGCKNCRDVAGGWDIAGWYHLSGFKTFCLL